MFKLIFTLNIVYLIGFVLFDSGTGFIFQMLFLAGYAFAKLVPTKVWLAIGEGVAETMPWIFIASIDL